MRLALPKRLARQLARKGKLTLRLRATVRGPVGDAQTIAATLAPRLKRARR